MCEWCPSWFYVALLWVHYEYFSVACAHVLVLWHCLIPLMWWPAVTCLTLISLVILDLLFQLHLLGLIMFWFIKSTPYVPVFPVSLCSSFWFELIFRFWLWFSLLLRYSMCLTFAAYFGGGSWVALNLLLMKCILSLYQGCQNQIGIIKSKDVQKVPALLYFCWKG